MPYKHILVPTDGSARSNKAIRAAVELAQKFDAQITALYVLGQGVPTIFSGAARRRSAAEAAGVRHSSARTTARAPWSAIVHAARAKNCDLIVMAAHGKRGLATLGSQTMKTVSHTGIPVLVCR